jgi:hypothetical protein
MKLLSMRKTVTKLLGNPDPARSDINGSIRSAKSVGLIGQVAGGLTVSICLGLLTLGKAAAADFSFTTIADTQGDFTSVEGGAAINDSGTVAFFANPATGDRGAYTASNGAITEIVNTNSLESLFNENLRFIGLDSSLDINNQDTIALSVTGILGSGLPSQRLVTIQDGSITTRATAEIRGSSGSSINGFDLNDQDELAYLNRSFFRIDETLNLNISRPNQPDVNVATASRIFTGSSFDFGDLASIEAFAINNQSEVTFEALVPENTSPPVPPVFRPTIFRGSGGPLTTLIEIGASDLDVNDSGDVVLSSDNALRLFNNASGMLTTIASGNNPAINNSGTIAFTTSLDDGGEGIFITSDSGLHEVIATGDTLLGSTVTNLSFSQEGFNNNGQIAFFAELADGTQGIFRADRVGAPPTSVPEPASAAGLLVLGALGLISRRHR